MQCAVVSPLRGGVMAEAIFQGCAPTTAASLSLVPPLAEGPVTTPRPSRNGR